MTGTPELPETRLLLAHEELWRDSNRVVLGGPPGTPIRDSGDRERASLVIVYLPKAKRRREYLIAEARSRATRVLVVGHKRAGIKSTTKWLPSLGEIVTIEHGSHCQLVMLELSERSAPPDLDEWERRYEARDLTLVTLPGVFSDGRLDAGSELLLDRLELPSSGRLLDLGCGSGVLGLWAKHTRDELDVTLADVDELAVESARRSARLNGLDVRCLVSDIYSDVAGRFDRIVTNPPFHQGVDTEYDVTRRIISEAPARLTPAGELWLVANHFLPWREPLEARFSEVALVHASTRFKVWRARRAGSTT